MPSKSSDCLAPVSRTEDQNHLIAEIDKKLKFLIPILKGPDIVRNLAAFGFRSSAASQSADSAGSDDRMAFSLALAQASLDLNTFTEGNNSCRAWPLSIVPPIYLRYCGQRITNCAS